MGVSYPVRLFVAEIVLEPLLSSGADRIVGAIRLGGLKTRLWGPSR